MVGSDAEAPVEGERPLAANRDIRTNVERLAAQPCNSRLLPALSRTAQPVSLDTPRAIPLDPFRALVFPNAVREQRRRKGYEALLALCERLPDIPYIRLSKIERGEVFAKASELQAIATVLGVAPEALLVDVEAPDWSIALWAGLRGEATGHNREAEEQAMLLAAAFRARRADDPELTLARLQEHYGLPAVIVSRIENVAKTPDRWNAQTLAAICAVLEIGDSRELPARLRAAHTTGALDAWLARIPGAADREEKTRLRIAALRRELGRLPLPTPAPLLRVADGQQQTPLFAARMLPVLGAPVADGLIDPLPGGESVPAPHGSGPNAYALRMCRPSLGAALPGHAILIVEPDRFPVRGGLAVLREGDARRVITLTTDRKGHLLGHSINPDMELLLDATDPADIAMVSAVLLG